MLPTQCLCTNLRRAARGVSRHYDGALDGFGINVAQYSLLCNLKRLDQP
ncbi:MAG: MarR family transcriptional regulator, partial [Pseudomonas sp.]|nr:MarR family transcriptional regulator [Pseudomonas sp.]